MDTGRDLPVRVEAKGLEPSNLLTASQALYQLSYAPVAWSEALFGGFLTCRSPPRSATNSATAG